MAHFLDFCIFPYFQDDKYNKNAEIIYFPCFQTGCSRFQIMWVHVDTFLFWFAVVAESQPFFVNVLVPWFSTCKMEITFPFIIKLL